MANKAVRNAAGEILDVRLDERSSCMSLMAGTV